MAQEAFLQGHTVKGCQWTRGCPLFSWIFALCGEERFLEATSGTQVDGPGRHQLSDACGSEPFASLRRRCLEGTML